MEKSLFSGFINKPCFNLEVRIHNTESALVDYYVFSDIDFMKLQSIQSLLFDFCISFDRTCEFVINFDPCFPVYEKA